MGPSKDAVMVSNSALVMSEAYAPNWELEKTVPS
jgi:hypothetical protein